MTTTIPPARQSSGAPLAADVVRHKSLREPPAEDDGLRIAVTRHTTGLRIEQMRLDYRLRDAAPSDGLLRAWRNHEIAWYGAQGFAQRYLAEQQQALHSTLFTYSYLGGGSARRYDGLRQRRRLHSDPITLLRQLIAQSPNGRITLLCWEDLRSVGQEHCHRELLVPLVRGVDPHVLAQGVGVPSSAEPGDLSPAE